MLMTLFQIPMPDVILSAGATDTPWLNWARDFFDAESITIMSPSALEANTYSFQVSNDGGVTSYTLQDNTATNVKFPAAGEAIVYNGILVGFDSVRFHSSGAIGADRAFKIFKSFRA